MKICTIVPDFKYIEDGKTVIEDAKGYQTDLWKFKWKLLQALYPDYDYRLS